MGAVCGRDAENVSMISKTDIIERVERPPKIILSELFTIQGIHIDHDDLDAAIDRLVATIKKSGGNGTRCDGVNTFDCFISYRVRSDKNSYIAERLYDKLMLKGIFPFLDTKKLVPGLQWKEGFLQGLQNSKVFLSLISRGALESCRDPSRNHSEDNVLLEIEVALNHRRASGNSGFIIPVLIGETHGGALYKFSDFSADLYAGNIHGISTSTQPLAIGAVNVNIEPSSNHQHGFAQGGGVLDMTLPEPEPLPLSDIAPIFEQFTTAVAAIIGDAIINSDRFEEHDKLYIILGEFRLIYSLQIIPKVSWRRCWHILPISARKVHNLDGCEPSQQNFICRSKGTSSYCILRHQGDRDAVLEHLRIMFAEKGVSIIKQL